MLNCVTKYRILSENIELYGEMSNSIEGCRIQSENCELYWEISDCIGQCRFASENVEFYRKMSNSIGKRRIPSENAKSCSGLPGRVRDSRRSELEFFISESPKKRASSTPTHKNKKIIILAFVNTLQTAFWEQPKFCEKCRIWPRGAKVGCQVAMVDHWVAINQVAQKALNQPPWDQAKYFGPE